MKVLNEEVKVAIHQPNYLPWLGYFYKIWAADVFVFLDDVQFARRSPTRRTRLPPRHGSSTFSYLSVSLQSPQYFDTIDKLKLNQAQAWRRKHLEAIRHLYSRSPFFKLIFPKLEEWFAGSISISHLSGFNMHLLEKILELLRIDTPCFLSSQLPVEGQKSGYIIALVKHLDGATYLSGNGARKYQQEADFREAGIRLVYSRFGDWLEKKTYPQAQGSSFLGGLSVLDALFNIGAEGVTDLFERYGKSNQ